MEKSTIYPNLMILSWHLNYRDCYEENIYLGVLFKINLQNLSLFYVILTQSSFINTWVGHVERMGEETGCIGSWWGKPDGKRPLGRPRRRWVDNIRMDLQEVGCGYMDWIGLAQDRDRWRTLVSAVMNLRVP